MRGESVDNPRAFPKPMHGSDGMELRDYFAAKAMQVILHPANERIYDEGEIADAAYSMADAMLKEREK